MFSGRCSVDPSKEFLLTSVSSTMTSMLRDRLRTALRERSERRCTFDLNVLDPQERHDAFTSVVGAVVVVAQHAEAKGSGGVRQRLGSFGISGASSTCFC